MLCYILVVQMAVFLTVVIMTRFFRNCSRAYGTVTLIAVNLNMTTH